MSDVKKARNKAISGFRVRVEHAIGGLKRFGIATEKCRNKDDKFNDQVMAISCGLWNYHLKCCRIRSWIEAVIRSFLIISQQV